jgi:Periplasmic protein involved in polysaccharide export
MAAWFIAATVLAHAAEDSASNTRPDYVLNASDLIRVQIFQEEDLTREVRVSQEFRIVLPLIGPIDVRGKTVRDLQDTIRDLYDRDFLVNPQVNVFVIEYAQRAVNVLGSVNSPGVVRFPQEQGLTLLDAIARVGGFSRLADRRKLKLTRVVEGKTRTYIINADEIIEGNSKDAWPLLQDDVIYVPERIL